MRNGKHAQKIPGKKHIFLEFSTLSNFEKNTEIAADFLREIFLALIAAVTPQHAWGKAAA